MKPIGMPCKVLYDRMQSTSEIGQDTVSSRDKLRAGSGGDEANWDDAAMEEKCSIVPD